MGGDRRGCQMEVDKFHLITRGKGRSPGQEMIEGGPQRVEISAVIYDLVIAACLLWRYVGESCGENVGFFAGSPGSSADFCPAEINKCNRLFFPVVHDIRGSEVTMDYIFLVNFNENPGHLDGNIKCPGYILLNIADHRGQGDSTAVLQDHDHAVAVFFEGVGLDYQFRSEGGSNRVFPGEVAEQLVFRVVASEEFENNGSVRPGVSRPVYYCGCAVVNFFRYPVMG